MQLIVLVGLPGSGKTYLGNQLVAELGGEAVFLDDEPLAGLEEELLKSEKLPNIIVAHPYLCLENERTKLVNLVNNLASDISIKWMYFENDPVKCRTNVKYRAEYRSVEMAISDLTNRYVILNNANIIKVWSINNNNSEIN